MLQNPQVPDSPKMNSTSIKKNLISFRNMNTSVIPTPREDFLRVGLRSLDKKLLISERMTSTQLKVESRGALEIKELTNPQLSQSMLPFTEIEKGGTKQSVSNQLVVLFLMSKILQQVRNTKDLNRCVGCIRDDLSLEECRQLQLFDDVDSDHLISEINEFSIGCHLKNNCEMKGLEVSGQMLKNINYVLNNSCKEPNFARAVGQLVKDFKLYKKKKTKVIKGSTLGKSCNINNKHKRKNQSDAGFNKSIQNKVRKKLDMKKNSLASSIKMMKMRILGKSKKFKEKIKKKPEKKKPKKRRKIKQKKKKAGLKDFTKKMIGWNIIRQIQNFKKDLPPQNEGKYDKFFQNLFLGKFASTRVVIIDCRYKYEFDGGHIKGAFNVCDPGVVQKLFFGHGWINTGEFLTHLEQFKDRHIDKPLAKQIMIQYEKKLLSRRAKNMEVHIKKVEKKENISFQKNLLDQRSRPNSKLSFYESVSNSKKGFLNIQVTPKNLYKKSVFDLQKEKKGIFEKFDRLSSVGSQSSLSINFVQKTQNRKKFSFESEMEITTPQKKEIRKAKLSGEIDKCKSEKLIELGSIRKIMKNIQNLKESAPLNAPNMIGTLLSNNADLEKSNHFSRLGKLRNPSRNQSKTFAKNSKLRSDNSVNVVIIFYCEFSSERAPNMYNFFRDLDRISNNYPNLHYPHIYLMAKGYEQFVRHFKYFCTRPLDTPACYTPSDRYSPETLQPKLKQFSFASNFPGNRHTSPYISANYIKSSNVISEKSCEQDFLLNSNEDHYEYKKKPTIEESLVIKKSSPLEINRETMHPFELHGYPKVKKKKKVIHSKSRSLQFDLTSKIFSNLKKNLGIDSLRESKRLKSKSLRAKKKKKKSMSKKMKAKTFRDLIKHKKKYSFCDLKGLLAQTRKKKFTKQKRPKKVNNKDKLREVFKKMNIKKKSYLTSKIKLDVPENFKTPFLNNARQKKSKMKPRTFRLKNISDHKSKRSFTSLFNVSLKRSISIKFRKKSRSKTPKKTLKQTKKKLIKKKQLNMSIPKESYPQIMRNEMLLSTLSVNRYRPMNDPKYNNHYILAKKEYKNFWKSIKEEKKRIRYNRTLSVQ